MNNNTGNTQPITLIATVGSSPAVLTEALWVLHKKEVWPVDEIVILTTTHGAEALNEHLFAYGSQQKGGYYQLCEELGIRPNDILVATGERLKGITDAEGKELGDIRNSTDDQAMAAATQQIVRKQCNRNGRRVIGLLSGGRKTMGSHLMAAMQLFARPDDQLVHVLVSQPFEWIKTFYFPTREPTLLQRRTITGETEGEYDASRAEVELINIPFVRLRTALEGQTAIDFSLSYDQLLAQVDEQLQSRYSYPVRSLKIHLASGSIFVNGAKNKISIPPRPLSIFCLFCLLNQKEGAARDITWGEVVASADYLAALHIIYRSIKHPGLDKMSAEAYEATVADAARDDVWAQKEYWNSQRLNTNNFARNRHALIKSIQEGLEKHELPSLKTEHLFRFNPSHDGMKATHRVPVPVKNIRIEGLSNDEIEGLL